MRCKSHAVFWSLLWFSLISELIIFPNHSLNRKYDCCSYSYHPPLISCLLLLPRSAKILLFCFKAADSTVASVYTNALKIFRSHHRRNRWPEDAAASCGGSQHLLGAGHGCGRRFCQYCRHSTRSMMRSMVRMLRDTTFQRKSGARTVRNPFLQASSSWLLQLQSTACLLQWPCMMLRRWVLSKLLHVIIFHCHFLTFLILFKKIVGY